MTMTNKVDVVDGDGHVVETATALAPFGWTGLSGNERIDGMLTRWADPEAVKGGIKPGARGAFEPEFRLSDMDLEGIDISVNYPSALLCVGDVPDVQDQIRLCRAYNDWFAESYHRPSDGRLKTVAVVPLGDMDTAVAEARRAVTDLHAVGILVPPYVGDRHLDEPVFDQLWATAVELGVPIGIHGGRSINKPHLHPESFRTQTRFFAMGHPFHQMFAMADVVLGGVLARHPELRVVFLEAGCGWMPWYIDRLDGAVEAMRHQSGGAEPAIDRPPSEYLLGGNCYFACEPDEPNLDTAVDWLGADQVIYASDYPHFDCAFPDSLRELSEHGGLSDETFAKVAGGNARRLYGL